MQPINFLREQLLNKIVEWCGSSAGIRALILTGSGARSENPADEWSDIDLVLVAQNAEVYLQSTGWIPAIDKPWVTTVERDGAGNIVERRVLFHNGIDVDFIILPCDRLQLLHEEPLCSILLRGARILLDQDGILPPLQEEGRKAAQPHPPSQEEFTEVVNDFWFHSVWTVKKIRRGELWTAKSCCDGYMKRLLLTMIEWHAQALAGWDQETWYSGRFIERWAGERVLERLPGIFAHYDEEDIRHALLNTMGLFDEIARVMAERLNYSYPEEEARSITDWVIINHKNPTQRRKDAKEERKV